MISVSDKSSFSINSGITHTVSPLEINSSRGDTVCINPEFIEKLDLSLTDILDAVYDRTDIHNTQLINEMTRLTRQLTDTGKDVKEILAENKNLKRSLDHKIDKLSENKNDSNQRLLKSVGEKLDDKLDPVYERMDQLYEALNSSNSSNNGFNLYPQELSSPLNNNIFSIRQWTKPRPSLQNSI